MNDPEFHFDYYKAVLLALVYWDCTESNGGPESHLHSNEEIFQCLLDPA